MKKKHSPKSKKTAVEKTVEPRHSKDANYQVDKLAVDAEKNALARAREEVRSPDGFGERTFDPHADRSQTVRHH